MAGIKMRFEIEDTVQFRDHVHMVGEAGYFFFPGGRAARGAEGFLEVSFRHLGQSVLLRAKVWAARASAGGVWLELPEARSCLDTIDQTMTRNEARFPSSQLVLLAPEGHPALLCRLLDVSDSGARIIASADDVGKLDTRVQIALPERGSEGQQLTAFGRVAWVGAGEVGVVWNRGDLTSRAAVRRMTELAQLEWENAQVSAHGPGCRFHKRHADSASAVG